jgi:hypothetical protein
MALEMRTECEKCGAGLTPEGEARICTFECTFCPSCSEAMNESAQIAAASSCRARGGLRSGAAAARPWISPDPALVAIRDDLTSIYGVKSSMISVARR